MWILQALLATSADLEKKGQAVKLSLFRRFRNVLAMSVLFSLVWSTYSMAASLEGYYEEHWKSRWSLTAVWEVFYVVILMVIALLWMPSKNSQRYAYSIQLATSDPDDGREEDGSYKFLDPNEIAKSYLHFYQQHKSSWSWEIELRPWVEKF